MRRAKDDFLQQNLSWFRHCEVEIVVADQANRSRSLSRKLEQKMRTVGEQIRLARLRRNLSVAQVAERATCSPLTVARIEKGTPTVSNLPSG